MDNLIKVVGRRVRSLYWTIRRKLRKTDNAPYRILMASVPRSGSTWLLRSMGMFPRGGTFPEDATVEFTRDLSKLPKRLFIKTHSTAPASLPQDVRAVFVFGDPIYSVVSTKHKRFDKKHFGNCGYFKDEEPDIYNEDALGYEKMFDTWMGKNPYKVLALRYETLGMYHKVIEEFCGISFPLEKQRARKTTVDPELQAQLARVYASFIDKVNKAPDAAIIGPDGVQVLEPK